MKHGWALQLAGSAFKRLHAARAGLGACVLVGVMGAVLGGCGYSARDEYMQIQSMAVPPMASADAAREQAYLVWAASREVTPDRALAEAMRLSRAGR
jgi:hypothetical protein